MIRFIAAVFLCLPLVQGCTIADQPYHPVCGDATCSPQALKDAVPTRTDLAIHQNGWGACLNDADHSQLDHSALAPHSRRERFQ